nr:RNA-directed DNA polymerase, eukaryota, reverse transcriptase zinc-binding domain protein [Tanacetum cinerariifolium]
MRRRTSPSVGKCLPIYNVAFIVVKDLFCEINGIGDHIGKSFVNVVKSIYKSGMVDCEANPTIVLDDDCLNSKDLTNSLLGRVKEFASLSNLKMVLTNKGFVDISVRYMGELWVLFEFASTKSKELFRDNVGVGSCFSELKQTSFDFNPDGRVVWVEVEGVPFKFWSGNTFKRLAAKWGELLDDDDQEESCFHSKRLCLYTKFHMNIFENFIFRGKVFLVRAKEVPGWVPELLEESDEEVQSDDGFMEGDNKVQYAGSSGDNREVAEVPETNFDESIGPKVNLSDDSFGIYPLLNKNDKENKENVNEKDQSLKYPPEVFAGRDGDSTNRGSKGDASESTLNDEENDRNVNGHKSQKCNTKEVFAGRDGDSTNRGSKGDALEFVCTGRFKKSEVPHTRGSFLCLIEEVVKVETKMENMELRYVMSCWGNYTFDYIHSNSIGNSGGILCAWDPNSFRKKINVCYGITWCNTINQWDGEVVIMGDFNEVRYKSDRFGSIFNGQGADEFNSFIANAGLEEVPLGGSAFTWCHKSATKMSKLNRFLISKNLFITCPHITATTLERYLSDHRPILLRETSMVHKRMEVINALQRIDKLNAIELIKIKWSVEGDANSRFFHGVLNKKRNQLNIQGVMVDGVWNENPHDVKRDFFQHFSNRFDKPTEHRAVVDMCYSRSLLIDQQEDLECMVTKEEVKKVVWDCGTDKSPGPDGFTFRFYRQFWLTIENDVFEAVSHFFTHADIPKGCNSSFIALIPKISNANKVNDFRPISLIGSIYKIIAKILANRLVRVLGDIVNEVQSAFIVERQILDGPFILNEVLQWCRIKKKRSLIFKVDFEKAMNMSKSKIMGVHVEGGMVKHVASKLGCLTLNTPFYYLGSTVGGSMSRVQAWKEVINKVKSRLSKWKMKALSIGGRLTLLKSVLGSIPIFHISIFRVPSSVLHTLESIRSQFFNGHEVGSNKATWVKWNNVLTAKDSEGVGVSSLYALNRGLMMKWVWRFYNQKTSLWANVIKAIHKEDRSMGKAKYVGARTCWMTIVNEIRILIDQGVNVLEFMRLKLGNGDMASFWNHNWSGGGVLKDLYPRWYALENGKSVNVCTKLSDPSMDYLFRRKARGGAEHEKLDALMDLVSTVNLVSMGDMWVWTLKSSGEFSVASLRKVIDEKRLPSVYSKTRWVKYVPIKVNVLAWKIKMDVLPTRLNISGRGMIFIPFRVLFVIVG